MSLVLLNTNSSILDPYISRLRLDTENIRTVTLPDGSEYLSAFLEDYETLYNYHYIAMPLCILPYQLPKPWVAGALIQRIKPFYHLYISKNLIDLQQDYWLQKGIKIYCESELSTHLVLKHRPDLISVMKKGDSEAALMFTDESKGIDLEGFEHFTITASEIPTPPGLGTSVFLCRKEDFQSRLILKGIHHLQTASCTNVERSIEREHLKKFGRPVLAWCYEDKLKNFHLHAARINPKTDKLEQLRQSQSSSKLLLKSICELWDLN